MVACMLLRMHGGIHACYACTVVRMHGCTHVRMRACVDDMPEL